MSPHPPVSCNMTTVGPVKWCPDQWHEDLSSELHQAAEATFDRGGRVLQATVRKIPNLTHSKRQVSTIWMESLSTRPHKVLNGAGIINRPSSVTGSPRKFIIMPRDLLSEFPLAFCDAD